MTITKQFVGDPIDRAYSALFAEQGAHLRSLGFPGPFANRSVTHDGKDYIALYAAPAAEFPELGEDELTCPPWLLAVYRLLPNGALKRLKRWPAEVEWTGPTGDRPGPLAPRPALLPTCIVCGGGVRTIKDGRWICSRCWQAEKDAAYKAESMRLNPPKPSAQPIFLGSDGTRYASPKVRDIWEARRQRDAQASEG
jgi:hypothetical protein